MSSAYARLMNRLDNLYINTGFAPTLIDVNREDFSEIVKHITVRHQQFSTPNILIVPHHGSIVRVIVSSDLDVAERVTEEEVRRTGMRLDPGMTFGCDRQFGNTSLYITNNGSKPVYFDMPHIVPAIEDGKVTKTYAGLDKFYREYMCKPFVADPPPTEKQARYLRDLLCPSAGSPFVPSPIDSKESAPAPIKYPGLVASCNHSYVNMGFGYPKLICTKCDADHPDNTSMHRERK